MITKCQKTFSIVNIVMGVILALSGFMMLSQPDTFPGPLIVLPLGLVFWLWGTKTLRCLRDDDVIFTANLPQNLTLIRQRS